MALMEDRRTVLAMPPDSFEHPVTSKDNVSSSPEPNSPDVPVHGGRAHDVVSDGEDSVHRLRLDGEAVAGGSEAIPVEDVDGPLAGPANHLLSPLHQCHGGQITALVLRQQIKAPPLDVEDAHSAVTAVETGD